jgi:hypothetical protein
MAPSFSAGTRQLDDRVRDRDVVGSSVEPMGLARNGVFVVDYSQGYDETPDRFSSHTSYSRSNYPIPSSTRRGEHSRLFKNDSIRRIEDSQIGRPQNGTPEWDGNDFSLSPVPQQYPQNGPGKKSFVYKHVPSYGMYDGGENGHDDLPRSARHAVQPGFQRIHYDAKVDSKPKTRPTMIEVSPGEFLRLRGADETWKAIHNDFYVPSVCVMCDLTLFCIQDAIFILCPECLTVNPLEGVVYDGYDGGVGMGFTMENLASWQEEIRREVNRG